MLWKISFTFLSIIFLLNGTSASQAVSPKYKQYIDSDNSNLLLLCAQCDDQRCYFCGGRQAKVGNLRAAHDTYLVGAQNAKTRSGYVCIFQLARLYEADQGVKSDLVQAYRWLSVFLRLNGPIDLRAAATTLRARVATKLSTEQIPSAKL